MNRDIKDLFARVKFPDMARVGAIVSLVVALGLFAMVMVSWFRVEARQRDIREEHASTVAAIDQIQRSQKTTPDDLRSRIAEAQSQLQAVLDGFPRADRATAKLSAYYGAANSFDAELLRMEGAPVEQRDARALYNVERFALQARGTVANLLYFIKYLAEDSYQTFLFDDLVIYPDGPAIAELQLAVYSSKLGQKAGPDQTAWPQLLETTAPPQVQSTIDPTEVNRLEAVMEGALSLGDWDTAMAYATRLLALAPDHPEAMEALYQAHMAKGRALVSEGRTSEAEQQFLASLEVAPGDEAAMAELGALQMTPTPLPTQGSVSTPLPLPEESATPTPQETSTEVPPTETPEETATPPGFVYIVQPWDSLRSIAERYSTTVEDLMLANDLAGRDIVVGQELIIPGR